MEPQTTAFFMKSTLMLHAQYTSRTKHCEKKGYKQYIYIYIYIPLVAKFYLIYFSIYTTYQNIFENTLKYSRGKVVTFQMSSKTHSKTSFISAMPVSPLVT
jgi:hypothetical protein